MPTLWCVECAHGELSERERSLSCRSCGVQYPIRDGIPDLTPRRRTGPSDAERRAERVIEDLRKWRAARDADPKDKARQANTTRDRLVRVLARAGVRGDVLDVGGCDGWVGGLLADGGSLSVIDPAPRSTDRAGVRICRGVAERLPFEAGTFDWVLMLSCFDYFTDPGAALTEASRVLKPDGGLLLIVPVHPEPTARFLEPHRGVDRVRAAFDRRLWRLLGPKRVVEEIRAAFRGGPRFHLHYYTADDVRSRLRAQLAVLWDEAEGGGISKVLVACARKRGG